MKKVYTLLLSIGVAGFSFGQTLTQANSAPSVGDTYTLYTADSNATPGNGGTNVTWDFSNLQGYGTSSIHHVIDASSTPDASNFSSSQIADTAAGSQTMYYSASSSSLNSQGMVMHNMNVAGQSLPEILVELTTDDEEIMTYPFVMGDSISDNVSGNIDVPSFGQTIPVSGTSYTVADGTGTIQLPNSLSIPNVIRTHTHLNLSGSSLGIGTITIIIDNYNFYNTDSSNYPLLQFTMIAFSATGQTQNINSVTSQYPLPAMSTGINSLTNLSTFSIFPNPASNNVHINVSLKKSSNVSLSIYDMTGRMVKNIVDNESITNKTFNINTSNLAKGLYNIVLRTSKGIATKKLIVE